MPRIDWCQDGITMALDTDGGLWFVLHADGDELARFTVDGAELRGTLAGRLTLQFSDGSGNGVAVEGVKTGLKIRVESNGHAPKNCRISREEVEKIDRLLNV